MNTVYAAPDGKVYDWAEPHIATIIDENGETIERTEHLYAKYLSVARFDDINNYILVDDPRSGN
jgi:hypothetical protein